MLVLFGFFYLWFGVITLVIWGIMLLMHLEEIDSHFDSFDFPNRGFKGIWPWGMGRGMAYGVFLLLPNSRFVQKKYPNARASINVAKIPRKIKFMVAFPMYTCVPCGMLLILGGVFVKMKEWFF